MDQTLVDDDTAKSYGATGEKLMLVIAPYSLTTTGYFAR
jgi:hypothetical protein